MARQRTSSLFRWALTLSAAAHVVALIVHVSKSEASVEREVRIPVVLEEPEPPPPPPPPPEKQEQKQVRRSPRPLRPALPEPEVDPAGDIEPDEVAVADVEEGPVEAVPVVKAPPKPKPKPKPKPQAVPHAVKVQLTRRYFAQIRSAIDSRKSYPFAARRLGATGDVRVSFSISPDGTFQGVTVRGSSGHGTLDQAALAAVRSVSGAVRRPVELGKVALRMSVVVHYELDS